MHVHRLAIVLVVVATACFVYAQPAPIPEKELSQFLGSVSPKTIEWTKTAGPDFDVYYGRARPPLTGEVGFYLGGHPDFQPDAGSAKVRGQLGIYPVDWHRRIAADGSVSQKALIRLDDYWQVDIWASAKLQADLDRLLAIVAQLPTFTKKPHPVGTQ